MPSHYLSSSAGIYSLIAALHVMLIFLEGLKILYILLAELCVYIHLHRDWNGSKKGHVYKFLRSQGFVSSYDIAHHSEHDTEESQKVCAMQHALIY